MTSSNEMSADEILAHGAMIAGSKTSDEFVRSLAAYFEEVVARETEPCNKIAMFVNGMLEGQHEAITKMEHVTRVEVESGLDDTSGYRRSAFVPACSCGWSSPPYYWSSLQTEELARKEAEGQCATHRFRALLLLSRDGVPS